ncbi:MAG: response regulator, partial [Desulfobacterales bacterium]|nr:response regulator [Desulfobacterales bacterium]
LLPRWHGVFESQFPQLKTTGDLPCIEVEMKCKNQPPLRVCLHGKVGQNQRGEFQRAHCVFQDVTAQRAAEELLQGELELNKAMAGLSREMLSELHDINKLSALTLDFARKITQSPHGFVATLEKNQIKTLTPTLATACGPQCHLIPPGRPFAPAVRAPVWARALEEGRGFFTHAPETNAMDLPPSCTTPLTNYMAVPVAIGDKTLGLISLANAPRPYTERDLISIQRLAEIFGLALHRQAYETERSQMSKTMLQLQKNEAIGVLAGGIAHDFNNILLPILGFAELLVEDLPKESDTGEYAGEILNGALRARSLVKQILSFSRRGEQEVRPIAPGKIMEEVTQLIRSTLPATIAVRREISHPDQTILADPTQIHQVLMNLVTNAYQAMQERGGRLTVGLDHFQLDHWQLSPHLSPGPYVRLWVKDTGTGMAPATLEKIFDPYFSTKSKDRGTGLGLSVAHGIIRNYHGDILVESRPGRGTCFTVYLPAGTEPLVHSNERIAGQSLRGRETILLVDDEVSILNYEKKMLERLGYTVESTQNSREALDRVRARPHGYDLIITDMTMPRLTGEELSLGIREIRGDIPIIVCTGFSQRMTPRRARDVGINCLLSKPVSRTELGEAIRRVLTAQGSP